MKLHKKKCIPCSGDVDPFSKSEIKKYLKEIKDWKVSINEKKAYFLHKVINLRIF